ncbi:hypothetical protein ALC62_01949 [Cyphomyrmex costatus]|uniref:Uncharacterized protein n=1 Tax=Cyphomyrmex costatus TaxID=456900 RepID=A0A151INP2_9HYME|nr:hypothetical protein ALC62_01949 [Cyphomyrmex costatus]
MGTNCLVINNNATSTKVIDQSFVDLCQEIPMKDVNEIVLPKDIPPLQLQGACAIDDIGGGEIQEINDKKNTFRNNNKETLVSSNDKETLVKRKIVKTPKRESAKDVHARREKEKAVRQNEYLKLKRIELQLKAKKYKAKYNIDIDNNVDENDEIL